MSGWGTFEPGAKYNGSSSQARGDNFDTDKKKLKNIFMQFLKYERAKLWDPKECNGTKTNYKG